MLERGFKSADRQIVAHDKGNPTLNKLDKRQDSSDVIGVTGRHNYYRDRVLSRTHNEIDRDSITADGGFGR